ncbi:MAG: ABC transporter permease, partial [Candidatus Eisenbacteria bacterium]
MSWERLRSIFWKEFIQMRRDRATLGLMLGVPIMQLMLFGFAIRQEVRDLPTMVFDMSRSQESRQLAQQFEATDNFHIRGQVNSYAKAIAAVDDGHARAVLVIPETYARDLKRGRPTEVQVLVDATDPTGANSAIGAALLVGQRTNVQILSSKVGALPNTTPVDMRVRPLYNPALDSALFIVPGIIGMILSNILIVTTAMAVVREREHGTLEQLIVTPLTRSEIMLGKIAPYALVGLVQISAVLIVGHFLFHVPVRGNLLIAYCVSFLFIVANLGLGLFISTLANNQAAAIQVSFFFLLPNVLLSGFMFPREAMPIGARWIGLVIPLTYFLQVIDAPLPQAAGVARVALLPRDARVPRGLRTPRLVLWPLRVDDAALDRDAVMSDPAALRRWSQSTWPADDFTLDENRVDLERHEREHERGMAFTFTVLDPDEARCLGCVYLTPVLGELAGSCGGAAHPVKLGFWVRSSEIAVDLDRHLLEALRGWLRDGWTFDAVVLAISRRD